MNFTLINLIVSPSRGGFKEKNVWSRKVTKNGVANSAYDALMKRNTKVVFLDMPQSNKLPAQFPRRQKSTSELNEVLKFYKTQYRIDYWRFPRVMDDSMFYRWSSFKF